MATLAMALPLLPGGKERLLKLAETVKGEKYEQHQDFFRRHNFQEQWYLQPTPMGDMVLLYLESDDIPGVFQSIAQTTDPYDLNHIAEAKAIHGVDFTQPPTGPLPETLLETTDAELDYDQNLAMVLPLREGGAERLRALAQAVTGDKVAEHQDFLHRHNFRENWYHQPTPVGDWLILYLQSDNLGRVFQEAQTTDHPYDHWHFDEAVAIHGVDFRQPPAGPLPELLFDSLD